MRTLVLFAAVLLASVTHAQSDALNGSVGGSGGGGGGGVSQSYVDNADALKLNLDASNDPLTGPLSAADGSATAPGLTFAGDTSSNSGFYLIANDQLGASINATLALSLTATALTVVPPLLAASGSVSAPSLAFSADADGTGTGIYRGAANDFRVAINGTQAFRLLDGTLYLGSSNTTYIDGYNSSSVTAFVGKGTRTDFLSGANSGNTTAASRIGDSTGYLEIYGGGQLRASPVATAITATTDTTTVIVSSAACRISSSGVSAWTPSETSAADGMFLTCVNTGADAITVTTSAGVCECGAGVVLGQWDAVELQYVSDRWVCTGSKDN